MIHARRATKRSFFAKGVLDKCRNEADPSLCLIGCRYTLPDRLEG